MINMQDNSYLPNVDKTMMNRYSYDQCKEALKLIRARMNALNRKDDNRYEEKEIGELSISTSAHNALAVQGLKTVGDILNFGLQNVYLIRLCGKTKSREIREAVYQDIPFDVLRNYVMNRIGNVYRINCREDYEEATELIKQYREKANVNGVMEKVPVDEQKLISNLIGLTQQYERHLKEYVHPRLKKQLKAE